MKLRIPETSVEYVVAEITSPTTIDTQWAVSMAFIPPDQKRPEVTDWVTAEWEADDIRTIVGPGTATVLACGTYDIWVKVDAVPESAIRRAGTLEVF